MIQTLGQIEGKQTDIVITSGLVMVECLGPWGTLAVGNLRTECQSQGTAVVVRFVTIGT